MALKIISANEKINVSNITVCIYASPGFGKTSLAFTADKPLLLDFDKGAYRSQFRKDSVVVENWSDVMGITEQDLKPYNTIVIDTVGRALDCLTFQILQESRQGKLKGVERAGGLSQQGWGVLKTRFINWLTQLRNFGKDVILLSHMTEEKKGDELIERLDIQGGAKNEVYKVSDLMGRIVKDGNLTQLNFNPSSVGFGKNPCNLDVLDVPSFSSEPHYFADVIKQVKTALNELSETAKEEQKKLDELHLKLSQIETVEGFNVALNEMLNAPVLHKKLLLDYARKKGIQFDSENKKFFVEIPEIKEELKEPESVEQVVKAEDILNDLP